MTRCLDFIELETRCYIPDEVFTVDVTVLADDGETPYAASAEYTVRFDWYAKDDEVYDKTTVPVLTAVDVTGDDLGLRITVVVPAVITAAWPTSGCRGVCRVMSGAGAAAETLCAFDMKLSEFAKNLG